ncbi:MAG: TonB-dependent receptor [Verrucomicrobia bacterium]|nr:TonB-dependent receptor [Verrucomicrobiota bacterium]
MQVRFRPLSAALLATAASLPAQTNPSPDPKAPTTVTLEAFTVTGTNIRRLDQEKSLPITIITAEELEARDAATPLGQMEGIAFITDIPENETPTNGIAGRGDNANIALRGLGAGNTLVLLNGRRMPFHPFTAGAISPVNVNVLPSAVQQIEVLRDGASSIYGSDAVAGVVNYIARRRPEGGDIAFRYGTTEHGGGTDYQLKIGYARPFAGGRGYTMVGASAYLRDPIYLRQREISRSADKTRYARDPFNAAGGSQDDRTPVGLWPRFTTGSSTTNRWLYPINGVPTLTTTTIPRSQYADYNTWVIGLPATTRYSLNSRVEYDLTPRLRVFGEFTGYTSHSRTERQPITLNSSDRAITLSADNPYNPFGSRFYSVNGAPNSDGTLRLTGAPQTITIGDMILADGGPETIKTTNRMHRLLAGFQGRIGQSTWTWEAAAMTGGVRATDSAVNSVRDSLLLAAANRRDATAWNPFPFTFKVQGNAVVADQPYANPESVRAAYTQPATRTGQTRVDSFDARTGGDVFDLWAGPIAVSIGAEWRRDVKHDHKPPFIGLNPPGSGLDPTDNDILVMSPRERFDASRSIASAYAETAVPLVAPKNRLPFLRSIDLSASARFEHYSDFGSTTKPKVGITWRPHSRVLVRASHNQGFLAPDLTRVYAPTQYSRSSPPGELDTVRSNFFTGAGRPADTRVLRLAYNVANPGLQPEISKGTSVGLGFEVPGIKGLSLTVDYWEIEQKNLIISDTRDVSRDEALLRAYTQAQLAAGVPISQINVGYRLTPGDESGNYRGDPNTLRAKVTPQDLDLFAAANANLARSRQLAPLGVWIGNVVTFKNSTGRNFTNGFDYSLRYTLPRTRLGQFRLSVEWAQFLNKFSKLTPTDEKNDAVHNMDLPRTKITSTLTWRKDNWNASVNVVYHTAIWTGSNASQASWDRLKDQVDYLRAIYNNGALAYHEIGEPQVMTNVGLGYRWGREASWWLRRTSIRLGVNNVQDREPTHSQDQTGYRGSLGQSLWIGRNYSLSYARDF